MGKREVPLQKGKQNEAGDEVQASKGVSHYAKVLVIGSHQGYQTGHGQRSYARLTGLKVLPLVTLSLRFR